MSFALNMKKTFLLGLLICCKLFGNPLMAQDIIQDSSSEVLAVSRSVNYYYKVIGENAHLYNGSEYIQTDSRIKGDPFFGSKEQQPGAIFYDGTLYSPVPVLYDILKDELVIDRYNAHFKIVLIKEKTDYFSFGGHKFIRVDPKADEESPEAGYYDLLFDGKVRVLARYKKKIVESIYLAEGSSFVQENAYFLQRGTQYYPVKTKKAALAVFKDKRGEVSRYLRKSGIKFKDDPQNAMVSMAKYYDQIKN